MTTGVIQRERVKTHPQVWKVRAFHTARGLCIFCSVTNFVSLPHSRDPGRTRPSFLKGLCLGAHTASSFIMSQEGTPQRVPLYLARSWYSNDVIKKWHLSPHCERIFPLGWGDCDTYSPRNSLQPQHLMHDDMSPSPWYTHAHTDTHTPQMHFLAEMDKEVKGLVQGHADGQEGQVIYTGHKAFGPVLCLLVLLPDLWSSTTSPPFQLSKCVMHTRNAIAIQCITYEQRLLANKNAVNLYSLWGFPNSGWCVFIFVPLELKSMPSST